MEILRQGESFVRDRSFGITFYAVDPHLAGNRKLSHYKMYSMLNRRKDLRYPAKKGHGVFLALNAGEQEA